MSSHFEDTFRELIQDAIKDQPVRVNSEDVNGLDDFVKETIKEERGVSADDVDGLDDFVKDAVNEAVKEEVEDYLKNHLVDAVNEEVDDTIDEKILTALKDHDDIRKVVKTIVRETLKDILSGVLS